MIASFFVAGVPVPQGSMRAFVHAGRATLTSDTGANLKHWRNAIGYEACRHFRYLASGPVTVTLEFVLPRPKALPKKHVRPLSTKKPDIDKLLRAALDAMTGIVYADDAQVCKVSMCKVVAAIGEQSGVHVRVETEPA